MNGTFHRADFTNPNDAVDRPLRIGLLSLKAVHYQVPLYRRLAADPRIDFTALFVSGDGVLRATDEGYAHPITWAGDHLTGYRSIFLDRGRRRSTPDFAVVHELLRQRFDVLWLHGYNHRTLQLGLWTQRALRLPVMIREEQTLIHTRRLGKALAKELLLRAALSNGPGLYLGTESARWFEHYSVPAERLVWVPYAVENGLLREGAIRLRGQRDELRKRFGIRSDSGPVVLTVCRLVKNKQPQALLEAFRLLRARVDSTLLIVGAGELEPALRQYVATHRIPDVVFAGFVNRDRISEAYAVADVFVLFSLAHETWGVAVNEAMNFALPLVVSDKCGCARDLVREGYNGHIVSSDRPEILAERLYSLAGDPAQRDEFGVRSRAIIDSYNYETAAAGVIRAAEMSVGRSGRASGVARPPVVGTEARSSLHAP
jgi:glycosyltransferase involved in cell wall biosynthesis